MKNHMFRVFAFTVVALLFSSCQFVSSVLLNKPLTKTAPVVNYVDLMGTVQLVNENGENLPDNRLVTVTIEGTNLTTQTDASGNYSIKGVKTGEVIIVFSKNGFATLKKEISLSGKETYQIHLQYLIKDTLFSVKDFMSKIIAGGFEFSGNLDKENGKIIDQQYTNFYREIIFFASSKNAVSSMNAESSYSISIGSENSFKASLMFSQLISNGFKSGQTIYFVAFGCSRIASETLNYEEFMDEIMHRSHSYYSLSPKPSNIISVSIP